MKRILLTIAVIGLLFTSCNDDLKGITHDQDIAMSDFYVYTSVDTNNVSSKGVSAKTTQKSCHAMIVLNRQLNENPNLENKMYAIKYNTRKFIVKKGKPNGNRNGRTATHEIGHYFNLRHIWGDGRCNPDDFVTETPKSYRSNGGCPTYPLVHCKTADMTMNYMDYTYDTCMHMFTDG